MNLYEAYNCQACLTLGVHHQAHEGTLPCIPASQPPSGFVSGPKHAKPIWPWDDHHCPALPSWTPCAGNSAMLWAGLDLDLDPVQAMPGRCRWCNAVTPWVWQAGRSTLLILVTKYAKPNRPWDNHCWPARPSWTPCAGHCAHTRPGGPVTFSDCSHAFAPLHSAASKGMLACVSSQTFMR